MARRPEEIGLNAPTEAIDVPRSTTYAPVEFSGQIAATQEGRSSLAEIPKSALFPNLYRSWNDFIT